MSARLTAVIASLALGGCGGIGAGSASTTKPSPLARARRMHEYPSSVRPQRARGARPSPVEAVLAFATAYINWNASTVSATMRALAARSIGQARAAVQLAAADTAQDYELRRGGIANSGSVQAIAPLRGSRTRFVVVTLERTSATNTTAYQGLRPAWHVAIAAVAWISPGGWVLSGWQPES